MQPSGADEGQLALIVDADVERAALAALARRSAERREIGEGHRAGRAVMVVDGDGVVGLARPQARRSSSPSAAHSRPARGRRGRGKPRRQGRCPPGWCRCSCRRPVRRPIPAGAVVGGPRPISGMSVITVGPAEAALPMILNFDSEVAGSADEARIGSTRTSGARGRAGNWPSPRRRRGLMAQLWCSSATPSPSASKRIMPQFCR